MIYLHESGSGKPSKVPPTMNTPTDDEISTILSSEVSAIRCYEEIIDQVEDDPKVVRLYKFKNDHVKAAQYWRSETVFSDAIPRKKSFVWEKVTDAFIRKSEIMGNRFALKALRNGEEHGLKVYKRMLESKKLTQSQKRKILCTFIPMHKQHIKNIKAIEDAI